jgi:hypothetical protein
MVAALSERKREGGVKRPWQARKEEALDQLWAASDKAVAVKAADVIHNAHDLARMDVEIHAIHRLDRAFVQKEVGFQTSN